jgi:hypothetical protein
MRETNDMGDLNIGWKMILKWILLKMMTNLPVPKACNALSTWITIGLYPAQEGPVPWTHALKMEAVCSSEILVSSLKFTRRCDPKDQHPQNFLLFSNFRKPCVIRWCMCETEFHIHNAARLVWVVEPLIAVPVHGLLRHFIHRVWWRHVNSHDPRLKVPVMQLGSVWHSATYRKIRQKLGEIVKKKVSCINLGGVFDKSKIGDRLRNVLRTGMCQRFFIALTRIMMI